jgi:hypothetical protein
MAVSLAVKAGRLVKSVTFVNGQPKIIDPDLADQEWERNTDPMKRENAMGGHGKAAASVGVPDGHPAIARVPLPQAPPSPEMDDNGVEAVGSATQREKIAKANMAELNFAKAAGELVPVRDVERRLIDVFTACKTRLLAIPSRARQQLPHLVTADVAVIEALVREACEDLAEGDV